MNQLKTVVILNGPPGSGKDTIAKALVEQNGYVHCEMKTTLFALACTLAGVTREEWDERYVDRKLKETPWDRLPVSEKTRDHFSQRHFLQFISEEVIKPKLGKRIFGEAETKKISYNNKDLDYVFSDGGFVEEVEPMLEADFGNFVLIHLYREGCSFFKSPDGKADTRRYIDIPGLQAYRIDNDEDIEEAILKVKQTIFAVRNNLDCIYAYEYKEGQH